MLFSSGASEARPSGAAASAASGRDLAPKGFKSLSVSVAVSASARCPSGAPGGTGIGMGVGIGVGDATCGELAQVVADCGETAQLPFTWPNGASGPLENTGAF